MRLVIGVQKQELVAHAREDMIMRLSRNWRHPAGSAKKAQHMQNEGRVHAGGRGRYIGQVGDEEGARELALDALDGGKLGAQQLDLLHPAAGLALRAAAGVRPHGSFHVVQRALRFQRHVRDRKLHDRVVLWCHEIDHCCVDANIQADTCKCPGHLKADAVLSKLELCYIHTLGPEA